MTTLLSTPKSAVSSIAPDPGDLDGLVLAAARVLDAHMLAVTALFDLDHDCAGCLDCTTVYVLEHLRETALDQIAAVLMGLGLYASDEEAHAYAEALERAETLAADRAAVRIATEDKTFDVTEQAAVHVRNLGAPSTGWEVA